MTATVRDDSLYELGSDLTVTRKNVSAKDSGKDQHGKKQVQVPQGTAPAPADLGKAENAPMVAHRHAAQRRR